MRLLSNAKKKPKSTNLRLQLSGNESNRSGHNPCSNTYYCIIVLRCCQT
nr:MAG TPA: hypothetical protein [Caudoviricetes sp.]